MEKDNSMLYIVAIIGIVAIVGLVVLITEQSSKNIVKGIQVENVDKYSSSGDAIGAACYGSKCAQQDNVQLASGGFFEDSECGGYSSKGSRCTFYNIGSDGMRRFVLWVPEAEIAAYSGLIKLCPWSNPC